jgi:hypothetical protein
MICSIRRISNRRSAVVSERKTICLASVITFHSEIRCTIMATTGSVKAPCLRHTTLLAALRFHRLIIPSLTPSTASTPPRLTRLVAPGQPERDHDPLVTTTCISCMTSSLPPPRTRGSATRRSWCCEVALRLRPRRPWQHVGIVPTRSKLLPRRLRHAHRVVRCPRLVREARADSIQLHAR